MANETNLKSINSLRLMYVKEIIFEHSDEEHFINLYEIADILKSDYNTTVTRQTLAADIDMLIDAGYDIECVKSNPNKYHVLSRDFDIAELRILIDAVESRCRRVSSFPPRLQSTGAYQEACKTRWPFR